MPSALTSKVIVLAVAGGSGSGKTTFARMLQAKLGDERCGILAQDSYYRDMHVYFDRDGGRVNFDHPDAIEFELIVKHLQCLKRGESVEVPKYDFSTHSRVGSSLFPPRPIILVDGILLYTQSELRPYFDVAFFIEAREEIRFQRRLERDVRERGRTPEGVRDQFYHHVKPMHDLFVEPSRKFADRIVSGESDFAPEIEKIAAVITQKLVPPRPAS